jgi:hypothetical protein
MMCVGEKPLISSWRKETKPDSLADCLPVYDIGKLEIYLNAVLRLKCSMMSYLDILRNLF